MIKIALTKGRLEDKTVERFAAAGYDVQAVRDKGRKLILPVGEDIQVVLAKAPGCAHLCGAGRVRRWRGGQGYHHGIRRFVL